MTERKRGSTQWRGCGRAEQQKQTQTLFGLCFIIGTYSINKMQIELSATLRWCSSATDFMHCCMPKGGDDRLVSLSTDDLLEVICYVI